MNVLSGLSKGQVLQRRGSRGGTVIINGTSPEDGLIKVTLMKAEKPLRGWKGRIAGKIIRGKFSFKLSSIPVGGPYCLRLQSGKQRIDVSPFFVGDVWILAGQSNMQGLGCMIGAARPHPLVHAFSMRREWRLAEDPLHILSESPDLCHTDVQCSMERGEELRKTSTNGVGVGLFFAREMVERSGGVPQGLICTAHGGTCMQQWSPRQKKFGRDSFYASMLASFQATAQPVCGVLWYQGESDANPQDAAHYTLRLKKLVAALRRDSRQPRLPWIVVQLARFFTEPTSPLAWNSIQEQQRLLPETIRFLETVPAIDLPLDDSVHIGAAGFPGLAARLASAADRLVYKNKSQLHMPRLRSVRSADNALFFAVEVLFDFVQGGLRAEGGPHGFRFVTPEGMPLDLIYKTELEGNKAILYLTKKPIEGTQLFYGHGFAPTCNLADARGFSPLVFGPLLTGKAKPRAFTPFITQWKVTRVVPSSKKLDQVLFSEVEGLDGIVKAYPGEGFIDEHGEWESKAGQAFFHSLLHISEPMELEFLMGYDGPFRLWLDGKPFFKDMRGTNPATPDTNAKTAFLRPGTHDLHVGMDLNQGRAWGFYLRSVRKDVTAKQIKTLQFVKPTCSVSLLRLN